MWIIKLIVIIQLQKSYIGETKRGLDTGLKQDKNNLKNFKPYP